jgi:hypothetical protein
VERQQRGYWSAAINRNHQTEAARGRETKGYGGMHFAGRMGVHALLSGFGAGDRTHRGLFEKLCRGAVSGGTGDDQTRPTAGTASQKRRRVEVLVAIVIMGARYKRGARARQAVQPYSRGGSVRSQATIALRSSSVILLK